MNDRLTSTQRRAALTLLETMGLAVDAIFAAGLTVWGFLDRVPIATFVGGFMLSGVAAATILWWVIAKVQDEG